MEYICTVNNQSNHLIGTKLFGLKKKIPLHTFRQPCFDFWEFENFRNLHRSIIDMSAAPTEKVLVLKWIAI